MELINKVLEQNIKNDLNDKYLNSDSFNSVVSKKANKLKKYAYENIIMDNYGEPIFDKENIKIGIRISKYECATIDSYYDKENNYCNKVSIKEFNEKNLTFKDDVIIS
jgi:hypothetical protein